MDARDDYLSRPHAIAELCRALAVGILYANVIRGERLYAANSYVADEYDLYVLRRTGDLAPLERERMDLILGDER